MIKNDCAQYRYSCCYKCRECDPWDLHDKRRDCNVLVQKVVSRDILGQCFSLLILLLQMKVLMYDIIITKSQQLTSQLLTKVVLKGPPQPGNSFVFLQDHHSYCVQLILIIMLLPPCCYENLINEIHFSKCNQFQYASMKSKGIYIPVHVGKLTDQQTL